MPADDFYTHLEPNHDVEVDEDGLQWVICPFEQLDDGQVVLHDHPVTRVCSWSANANEEEVNCPVCEVFHGELHFAGAPPHEHPGEDELEDPDDPQQPIGGGSHGSRHHISEYTYCKIPLRRIEFVRGVWVTVHEGAVASLGRIRDRYEELDGYKRYPIRQSDTAFYVCRRTVSGKSMSKHGLCAGDINWGTNGYGASRYDLPMWFVQLFLDEGWGWGGFWIRVKDWMHMSKSLNEGGDGWLYVGSIDEEDWFDMATKAELAEVIEEILERRLGPEYEDANGKPLVPTSMLVESTPEDGKVDGIKQTRRDIIKLRDEVAALDVPRKPAG